MHDQDQDQDHTIDLTAEIDRLRNQIIYLQRMASLGELLAAVSHEVKNPLGFIKNFSELATELAQSLQLEVAVPEKKGESRARLLEVLAQLQFNLGKITDNCDRACLILENMLIHARSQSTGFEKINLHKLLDEYLALTYVRARTGLSGFNMNIQKEYADAMPLIEVNERDLSRVFLNIFNNACDAMFARQQKNEPEYVPELLLSTAFSGEMVTIRVRDNGTGIKSGDISQIFDRFFTTRKTPGATGLGLAICKEIVSRHHGRIEVLAEEGRFTEVVIELPVVQQSVD